MARLKRLSYRILDRLRGDESGQSLIIIAFAFIALVAVVGLAIDLGILYLEKTRLGLAMDGAALAGAHELPNEVAAVDRAEEYLKINGYDPNDPDVSPPTFDFPDEPIGGYHYQLSVTGTKTVPLTFLRVLGFTTIDVTANAVGETANKLDIMLVLDRTGSMDDDTCYITRDEGLPTQYACNPWLTNITNLFSDDFGSGLVNWTVQGDATPETGHARLAGGWSPGSMYRADDTTGYDVVKVAFKAKSSGLDWGERLALFWRIGPGGSIYTAWSGRPPTGFQEYQVELPTGAADIPNLYWGFRIYANRSYEFALIDDVTLDAANWGLGPWDGEHDPADRCDGGWGVQGWQDCGDSDDPFMNYIHEQPIYDTLVAADNFLDFLNPDIDQVGLATYNESADVDVPLTSDFDEIINILYDSDEVNPDRCTNISAGINAGSQGLIDGRPNATHVMILLSDGWSNTWAGSPACAWPCYTGSCPEPYICYEGTSEPWGKVREAYRWARDHGIIIFTIGQGACVNEDLLRDIAEETFGRYYWAPTTDDLDEVFEAIAEYIFLRLVK